MGKILQQRLKQSAFQSPYQEAMLNLMVANAHLKKDLESLCVPFGVTYVQYNVLRILRGVYPEGHARYEISRRMVYQAPDVTRLLDKLAVKGYIKRAPGLEDKRQSVSMITENGLKLLEVMDPVIDNFDASLGDVLSEEESQTLSALLEKIYAKHL